MVYPLFETALRADARRGRRRAPAATSASCGRASRRSRPTIRTRGRAPPTRARRSARSRDDNRMVCFPYPKRMCANIDVDQARGARCCAPYEAARAAGVADDRMVFLHAAAETHDHWFVTERWSLTDSPGDRGRGRRRRARRGRHLDRRHRALRSLLVLPVGGADRDARARAPARRSAAAHGDRRARIRRRAGQQLSDARDRTHGRRAPRRPGQLRAARPRSAGTSASTRRGSGRRRRPRAASAGSTRQRARRRSTRSPAASPPAWSPVRRQSRRAPSRTNATAASLGHRHRAHAPTAGVRWRTRATPTCSGRSRRKHKKAGRSSSATMAPRTRCTCEATLTRPHARCAGATKRCARCGSGQLFRRWFTMAGDCPRCGLHFEREAGYWTGALAINMIIIGGIFAVSFVIALALTIPDVPVAPLLAVFVPLMAVGPLITYPFSQDDLGRGGPSVPPTPRPHCVTRRADRPHLIRSG